MNVNTDYNLNLNLNATGENKKAQNAVKGLDIKGAGAAVEAEIKFAKVLDESSQRIESARELLNSGKLDDGSLLGQTARNILDMGI